MRLGPSSHSRNRPRGTRILFHGDGLRAGDSFLHTVFAKEEGGNFLTDLGETRPEKCRPDQQKYYTSEHSRPGT